MTPTARLSVAIVSVGICTAIAAASQLRLESSVDDAILRLSWRTEPVRVETCRTLTEEELADIPAHMRRAEECEGYFADYELSVTIGDRVAVVDTVSPSGLRGDRPVYVLREHRLEPGTHQVEVSYTALVPDDFAAGDRPVRLEFGGDWTLAAREVGLLTMDPTGSRLVRSGSDVP